MWTDNVEHRRETDSPSFISWIWTEFSHQARPEKLQLEWCLHRKPSGEISKSKTQKIKTKNLDTVGRKEDFVRKQFKLKFTGKSHSSFLSAWPKIFQNHGERISKHFQKQAYKWALVLDSFKSETWESYKEFPEGKILYKMQYLLPNRRWWGAVGKKARSKTLTRSSLWLLHSPGYCWNHRGKRWPPGQHMSQPTRSCHSQCVRLYMVHCLLCTLSLLREAGFCKTNRKESLV